MHTGLLTYQILLLLLMMLLATLSWRTSRANRWRHQCLMAVSAVALIVTYSFAMMSISNFVEVGPEDLMTYLKAAPLALALELLLTFVPPLLTSLMCVMIFRRGLSRPQRNRPRPPAGSLG